MERFAKIITLLFVVFTSMDCGGTGDGEGNGDPPVCGDKTDCLTDVVQPPDVVIDTGVDSGCKPVDFVQPANNNFFNPECIPDVCKPWPEYFQQGEIICDDPEGEFSGQGFMLPNTHHGVGGDYCRITITGCKSAPLGPDILKIDPTNTFFVWVTTSGSGYPKEIKCYPTSGEPICLRGLDGACVVESDTQ